MNDQDRVIAREVLKRAVKQQTNQVKYSAYQVARATWGGKDDSE